MKNLKIHAMIFLTGVIFLLFALAPAQLSAQDILEGSDLFVTVEDNTWDYHFFSDSGGIPLPADFFGPGSDPFDQPIQFSGAPLDATEDLGNTSAIVERLEPAFLPSIGDSATIAVEIRALHLVSTNPIIVTYNGGLDPEQWQVEICLSSIQPQVPGTMTITRDCAAGGHFTSIFPVDPLVKFTPLEGPGSVITLDPVPFEPPEMTTVGCAYWVHDDALASPISIVKSPGGGLVDHNCDGGIDIPYPPTSNFIAGMRPWPCDEENEATISGKSMTQEEARWALHGVLPPQETPQVEGACCLHCGTCIITTQANCEANGGTYHGDETICIGDLDCDGVDESCPKHTGVPTFTEWGLIVLVALLILSAIIIIYKRRRRTV